MKIDHLTKMKMLLFIQYMTINPITYKLFVATKCIPLIHKNNIYHMIILQFSVNQI